MTTEVTSPAVPWLYAKVSSVLCSTCGVKTRSCLCLSCCTSLEALPCICC